MWPLIAFSTLLAAATGALVGDAVPKARGVTNSGTFRVGLRAPLDSIDPALAYDTESWALLDTVCARLMTHPDLPTPASGRLVPDVASAFPRVSHDAKTYTFVLRKGLRFSDGTPIRASAFAREIDRILTPAMNSPAIPYVRDIVGAEQVLAGRASSPSGLHTKGDRLTIHFKRPVPDFAARTTMTFFCAVPPTLPIDPEGVEAFPGSGPYYVASYVRDSRLVIKRNPFYRGKRPHHVDEFDVDLQTSGGLGSDVLDKVQRGDVDAGLDIAPPAFFDPTRGLARLYGVNKSRFFVKPGPLLAAYALNTSGRLFRNNPRLRQAVNFAIDRSALLLSRGSPLAGRLTDQYLPPATPGFQNAHVYPLAHPDLRRARALARGHTRGGKVVLYVFDVPPAIARGQIVEKDLARIGLHVAVTPIPLTAYGARVFRPRAPFDIAMLEFSPDYVDPFEYLNVLFERDLPMGVGFDISHFHSPVFDRLLRAAALLRGTARDRAYGKLDVRLTRDAAPLIAYAVANEPTFVSARVGCVVVRPALDLAAACLK